MKRKAVINIGAGTNQVLLIKSIKALGFSVVSVDRDPQAPGFKYSDTCLTLSTYEAGPIISALNGLKKDYQFKGVFTRSSGPPVITTATVAESLGLPGATRQAAAIVIDKNKFMSSCRAHAIKTPQSRAINETNYPELASSSLPCVIKPALSLVGKSGVTLVKNKSMVSAAYHFAKSCSYTGEVLLEDYIPGDDVGLISVVFQSRVYPVVLVRELNEFGLDGRVRARGVSMPYSMGESMDRSIYALAQSAVEAAGVAFGPFLMSCRCSEGTSPTLIETHLDFGGDGILDELFPLSTDFDFIKYVLEVVLQIRAPEIKKDIHFRPSAIQADIINESGAGG